MTQRTSRAPSLLRWFGLAALLAFAAAATAARPSREGELRLHRLFADGMVVQRDKPIPVWGWAAPGTDVTVAFRGDTRRARANRAGEWRVALPPHSAGGPFTLDVRGGDAHLAIHDVLAGDVWVASGQSNMEFQLALANDAAREIANAHDSLIRQFKVPNSWSDSAASDLAGGSWIPADPRHAAGFSAVAYFFARDLRAAVHVPIGIINTTWGGSNIETWIAREAQHLSADSVAAIVRGEEHQLLVLRDALRARLGELPSVDSGLVGGVARWAAPSLDDAAWSRMPVPAYWEPNGYAGVDGVAWYRVAIRLDSADLRRGVSISFAAIDDDDITWLNGIEIGRTTGYNVPRRYRVPAGAAHTGENLLAVRVADGGGGGGINGSAFLEFEDGTRRSLAGTWRFKLAAVSFQLDGQRINKIPARLYNKMLNPLLPFPVKGVIWYQGESNANNMEQASAYREQFRTLITSWRAAWRENLPFLWVQLPNYGGVDAEPPGQAAWATQRESMDAALALANTGRAIAIDVGDPGDIHPRNKQDVGARLARVALRRVYSRPVIDAGPTYRAHTVRGDTVFIEFSNVANGLVTHSAEGALGGFAVAGRDRRFAWANARIVGNRVKVWSERVHAPVAVRYAWANNPEGVNLYNREQLPAAPFRTDRW